MQIASNEGYVDNGLRLPDFQHGNEVAGKLVLWQPTSRRRRRLTYVYVDTLLEDTGMDTIQELRTIMEDYDEWRECVTAVGCPDR